FRPSLFICFQGSRLTNPCQTLLPPPLRGFFCRCLPHANPLGIFIVTHKTIYMPSFGLRVARVLKPTLEGALCLKSCWRLCCFPALSRSLPVSCSKPAQLL